MKIDIRSIIIDHFATLRNAETNRVSTSDIIIFFIIPACLGIILFFYKFSFKSSDAYNLSVTFFGIFIALLLNLQVAIFSIFQRQWKAPADPRLNEQHAESIKNRQTLLSELNANLSYLILICCFCLIFALLFFINDYVDEFGPAMTAALYSHFILTLLMIVKRSHALFQSEYDRSQASS